MGKKHKSHDAEKPHKHKTKHKSKKSKRDDSPDAPVAPARATEDLNLAAEYIRALLKKYPAEKAGLRDVLWRIDHGEGVRIEGVAASSVQAALKGVFVNLNLRHTEQGTYALRAGQDKILRRVGIVFDEALPDRSSLPLLLPDPSPARNSPRQRSRSPSLPPAPAPSCAAGPQAPEDDPAGPLAAGAGPDEPSRRVLGPAVPSSALRHAAAHAAEALRAAGVGPAGSVAAAGLEALVGPTAPAELVAEDAKSSRGDREKEVERVMALVRAAGPQPPDAYDLLAISPDSSASLVKKRFWRLSLLLHPDKCPHPAAAAAFDALQRATRALQDPSSRAALDQRRADAADDAVNRQVAAELERERRWRVAQGRGTEEDLAGGPEAAAAAAAEGPLERDDWMTTLEAPRATG